MVQRQKRALPQSASLTAPSKREPWDRAKGNLRAPSAPSGHLPREGEVYMGRFLNRPYLFSSLFSVLCSLFSKFQREGRSAFHTFAAAKSSPCRVRGRAGFRKHSRQYRAVGDVCGRSQNAPTCQMHHCSISCQRQPPPHPPRWGTWRRRPKDFTAPYKGEGYACLSRQYRAKGVPTGKQINRTP